MRNIYFSKYFLNFIGNRIYIQLLYYMIFIISILCFANQISAQQVIPTGCVPFGLRLTYGEYFTQQGGITQLYVGFNTIDDCPQSYVGFGNINTYSNFSCTSQSINFTWATPPYFNTTVFSCAITNIDFAQKILYTAIGVDANNNSFPFMSKNVSTFLYDKDTQETLNFLVFGDWNYYSPLNQSMPQPITNCLNLIDKYQSVSIQAIIFLGDQAYELQDNNGTNYVNFLLMLQTYSSIWPFMATPGNHDVTNDNNYIFRRTYTYPYQYDLYFNLVIGQVTFISFNPYDIVYGMPNSDAVMNSLLAQLTKTITSANTTFIIPYSHYPFFCSQNASTQCSTNNQSLYPIQQLFNQYQVDLYLSAHIHNYQREYPTNAQGVVVNDNMWIYQNPRAPLYILEGDAGNTEVMPNSTGSIQYFTAYASIGTGYGILTLNRSSKYSKTLQYNHTNATNCLVDDNITAIYSIQSSSNIFPVWGVVELALIIIVAIAFILYCFYSYRMRLSVEQRKNSFQMSENYQKV